MRSLPVFVGLDCHHDSVRVCVLDAAGKSLANRDVENDAAAVAELIGRQGRAARVAIEASCGAAHLADEWRIRHGLPLELAHPGYVARLKRSPDKSDLSDSRLLTDLARVNYLPPVWLAPESIRRLRRLVRYRAQLVARRKEVKLRIRGLLRENRVRHDEARAWTKAWLDWLRNGAELVGSDRWLAQEHLAEIEALTGRIRAAEEQLQAATADDRLVSYLMSLHGVGLITAVTLRAEIGRFDRFQTGKQLARFCCVTPRNASSGARQADAGLIAAGNPELRMVLIELAHRLMRYEGQWKTFSQKMLKRGKPWNVTAAAVANRWVRWLFHQCRQADLRSGSTEGAHPRSR